MEVYQYYKTWQDSVLDSDSYEKHNSPWFENEQLNTFFIPAHYTGEGYQIAACLSNMQGFSGGPSWILPKMF